MVMMILTTTHGIEGHEVLQYKGIVTAHVIEGANALQDFASKVSDIVGGRVSGFERTLQVAARKALDELRTQAEAVGANAVIGIDLDYEAIQVVGHLLMVVATGTAVSVKKGPKEPRPVVDGDAGGERRGARDDDAREMRASEGPGDAVGPAFFGGLGGRLGSTGRVED